MACDCGRRTRILREEHDAVTLPKWEAREDRWAYAFSLAKLFTSGRVSGPVHVRMPSSAHPLELSVNSGGVAAGQPLWCHVRAQSETAVRLVARVVLLLFPGSSDHMPCDYERALREELP